MGEAGQAGWDASEKISSAVERVITCWQLVAALQEQQARYQDDSLAEQSSRTSHRGGYPSCL